MATRRRVTRTETREAAEEVLKTPIELPDEPTAQEVVYESDLRAAAHRNGHAGYLLEPEGTNDVGGPPEPPEEEPEHRHLPDGPARQRNIVLGLVYLGAGAVAIYIGIAMIRGTTPKENQK